MGNLRWRHVNLKTYVNLYISACIQDSNAIPTAISMFSGFSYAMGSGGNVVRPERNRKWEIQDGGIYIENSFTSACAQVNNEMLTAEFMLPGYSNSTRLWRRVLTGGQNRAPFVLIRMEQH